MKSCLPSTGTAKLLEALSPHIPDDFINGLMPRSLGRGRRQALRSSQLWRTHLLALLPMNTGLSQMFLNSLRLTWTMSLMADAAVLLRVFALTRNPTIHLPMFELTPKQMSMDFGREFEKIERFTKNQKMVRNPD
jgi:hypothetical protein